jgi:hypothetical protein
MKKLSVFLAVALFAMFFASCSSEEEVCGGDNDNGSSSSYGGSSSSGTSGGGNVTTGDQLYNAETERPYTGSGKVYMMERRGGNDGRPILTEDNMLLVGTVNNGKINLDFPQNAPSHFLQSFEDAPMPAELNIEPLSAKFWFYVNPLYLVGNNGNLIGFTELAKEGEYQAHRISYWYFSEKTSISGILEGEIDEFDIDTEGGWSEIYWDIGKTPTSIQSVRITTDLSNVPEDLKWLFWEY